MSDDLARVILKGLREPLALESGSIPAPSQLEAAAAAVRSFLLSEERVEAGRKAILENLRDRRLLKWLFAEDPEHYGAIGYVDGPIDAETQNECAGSLARAALAAAMGGE